MIMKFSCNKISLLNFSWKFVRKSFLGLLLPDSDWVSFCDLWNYERECHHLQLKNKLCFIVVKGKVAAHIQPTKSAMSSDNSTIVRHFKCGEVIHLFSNQDKIPRDSDGSALVFGNVQLSFVPDKGTSVISLGRVEYNHFIRDRPRLTSLSAFMGLRMSDLVGSHIYFEGVSPDKVSRQRLYSTQLLFCSIMSYALFCCCSFTTCHILSFPFHSICFCQESFVCCVRTDGATELCKK